MKEYKEIKGFEDYKINRNGEIISYKRINPKKIKHHIKGNGYIEVTLSDKKGSYKQVGLHRLLAETFLDKPTGATVVNHKNGNTTDFRLSNLEWITQSQNKLHSIYELKKKTITQKTIVVDGVEYESLRLCAEAFGISYKNLSRQLTRGIIPKALRGHKVEIKIKR